MEINNDRIIESHIFGGSEADEIAAELPAECPTRDQRALMVKMALQALPAEMRQVIILKEYAGLTLIEIAEILGVPINAVKLQLHAGLQQMHVRLEQIRGEL